MRDVHFYSILAGVLWGIWPLLMNRSGVAGFASGTIFAGIAFVVVLPVALWSRQIQQVSISPVLLFAVAAGVCGGLGVLAFNTMLAKVTPAEVGRMFILMVVIQLAMPAIYHMIQSGDYSPRRVVGITGAFVVAYLLA